MRRKVCYIYALYDPRKPRMTRYVGKANDVEKRLQVHIKQAMFTKIHTHKLDWIRSLLKVSMGPKVKVLEQVTEKRWESRERFWIKECRRRNHPLTNGTDGGDGGCMGVDARKKISKSLSGRVNGPPNAKTRQKISAAQHKSYSGHSGDLRRLKLSKAIKKKFLGRSGKKYRDNIIKAQRKSYAGPNGNLRRERIGKSNSIALLGRHLSAEHRNNISKSLRKRSI